MKVDMIVKFVIFLFYLHALFLSYYIADNYFRYFLYTSTMITLCLQIT